VRLERLGRQCLEEQVLVVGIEGLGDALRAGHVNGGAEVAEESLLAGAEVKGAPKRDESAGPGRDGHGMARALRAIPQPREVDEPSRSVHTHA
jgi:hypothetical protein